jgi:hypothetical protein
MTLLACALVLALQGLPGARGSGGASFSLRNGSCSGDEPFACRRPSARRGTTAATEKAVLEGQRWLVRHQNPDGSWGEDTLRERCSPDHPCIPRGVEVRPYYNEGLTGLALLAFLGTGHGPGAKEKLHDTATGKRYVLGDVVTRGLQWLVDRQKEDGSFSATRVFLYNEALCAGKDPWQGPAQKAVDFLVAAQKKHPEDGDRWGWRYDSGAVIEARKAKGEIDADDYSVEIADSDLSVTGWVITALKSARICGLEVPEEALQGGLGFARYVTAEDGLAGYQKPGGAGKAVKGLRDEYDYHTGTMSALSMLVRTFVARDLGDPFLEEAAQHILKDLPWISPNKLSVDYYYWYQASLALHQFDGPDSPRKKTGTYWAPWKKAMEKAILELQDENQEQDACSRGGWLVDDRWSHAGRALYNTAINVLTLEVYYRYENAFEGGKR